MTREFHIHAVLSLLLVQVLSCAGKDGSEPVGIRLQFLDGEGGALPGSVTSLQITVAPYASTSASCSPADPAPISATFQVADMTDLDDNGRREAVLSDVPYGCALYATVEAYEDSDLAYSGRSDGIVLSSEGQRRFIDMTLTQDDAVTDLGGDTALDEPAFGLTATPLAETDGRVLIAGGFTTATGVDCATEGYEEGDLCFVLAATDRAYVFDQGSGQVIATQNPMTAARALHTATLLPDGRVMLAGGVASALLVLRPGTPSWAGYEIVDIAPHGGSLALSSYDVFDPGAGAETADPDRDGDVGRGRFDAAPPGGMRHGRFGHASTTLLTPGLPGTHLRRVMLAGGFGVEADTSIEVFTLDEPSTQTGFLTTETGSLATDPIVRTAPGSVMAGDYVYVFGGTAMPGDLTTSDLDMAVAERWNASTDGNEWNVAPVAYDGFSTEDHPEWVRMFPAAVPLGTAGDAILVSGWYGARCTDDAGSALPNYDYTAGSAICPAPGSGFSGTGDLIVTTLSGTPTIGLADATSTPHALGSVIRLEQGPRQGQVLVAGGIADGDFTTTKVLDLYTGNTTPGGQVDHEFGHELNFARALGAAAELGGGNVLFAGGAQFSLASEQIVILESVELLNWAD
jgi:hypothetical protein